MKKTTPRKRATRGYTREFTPAAWGTAGKRYLLDGIPPALWIAVRAKCRRDGISVRAAILTLLQKWSAK